MTKVLGVEFAPLSIPLDRRLQTLAVMHYVALFLFVPVVVLVLFAYLLTTSYWWLVALYGVWVMYDWDTPKKGSWRLPSWRRNALWKYTASYFPIKLIKTAPLDPNRNYIMGYHPHGVVSMGALCSFGTDATGFPELFPGLTAHLCTLVGQFWFPLRREYVMATGAVEVSRPSIQYLLTRPTKGHAVVIVIGGATEALDARPNHQTLHLSRRKGFVRMALTQGADLVPIFSFGENNLFEQVENPEGSRLRSFQASIAVTRRHSYVGLVEVWFKSYFGFSPPVFSGRGIFNYSFGLLPFRRPINTVVGAAIRVEKCTSPSHEQVDELHTKYVSALVDLFEKNKAQYGVEQDMHITFK